MKLIIAALVLISSVVASAETHRIVSIDAFDLSYTGGLVFKSDNAKNGTNKTGTEFKFNLNYAQDLNNVNGLMIKGIAFFNRDKSKWGTETLDSNLGAGVGLIYNFDPSDVKNSFFVSGLGGLEKSKMEGRGGSRKSGVNVFLITEAGKRWDLGRYSMVNISYAPTVSFEYTRYGGAIRKNYFTSGTELKINFLKFDVLF